MAGRVSGREEFIRLCRDMGGYAELLPCEWFNRWPAGPSGRSAYYRSEPLIVAVDGEEKIYCCVPPGWRPGPRGTPPRSGRVVSIGGC